MPLPKLLFEGETRTVEVPHLGRHADLQAQVGQLVWKGSALGHTFAQTLKHEPTPEEVLQEASGKAAQKELSGLDAEEAAMRKSELWSQFASSFAQRRAALQKQASFKVATPPAAKAPPPVLRLLLQASNGKRRPFPRYPAKRPNTRRASRCRRWPPDEMRIFFVLFFNTRRPFHRTGRAGLGHERRRATPPGRRWKNRSRQRNIAQTPRGVVHRVSDH